MRRSDFMKMIKSSFPSWGLTCSFQDHQLSQFIQIKRRTAKHIPTKKAVSLVGPQDNHVCDNASACKIYLPLDDQSLEPLLNQLKVIMRHNFFPTLMLMGSTVMALHYSAIKNKFGLSSSNCFWSTRYWKDNCIEVLPFNDGVIATKTMVKWDKANV